MKRLHLIEFHEQPWVPGFLRRGVTDYLRVATQVGGQNRLIRNLIQELIETTGQQSIIDLGSGAGGAWIDIHPQLTSPDGGTIQVKLSDLNPRPEVWETLREASGGAIEFATESVDARQAHSPGIRTLLNVFHHFRPAEAREILAEATAQRQPILVAEAMDKSWVQGLLIILLAPLMTWLLTPMIRPFRWRRILFTYLIPILPILIAWDGVVSVIRLYSLPEYKQLIAPLEGMTWQVGKKQEKGLTVMYLVGIPDQPGSHPAPS